MIYDWKLKKNMFFSQDNLRTFLIVSTSLSVVLRVQTVIHIILLHPDHHCCCEKVN